MSRIIATLIRWNDAYDRLPRDLRFYAFIAPYFVGLAVGSIFDQYWIIILTMILALLFRLPVLRR